MKQKMTMKGRESTLRAIFMIIFAVSFGSYCDAQFTTIEVEPSTSSIEGSSIVSTDYNGEGTYDTYFGTKRVRRCLIVGSSIAYSDPDDPDGDGITESDNGKFISNCDTGATKLILTILNLTEADNNTEVKFETSVGTPVQTNLIVIYCPEAPSNENYTCENCDSANTFNCSSNCACAEGYETVRSATTTCQNDATWTEPDIQCTLIPSTTVDTATTTTTEPDGVVVCLWCIILLSVAVAIIVILLILICCGCLKWKGCSKCRGCLNSSTTDREYLPGKTAVIT